MAYGKKKPWAEGGRVKLEVHISSSYSPLFLRPHAGPHSLLTSLPPYQGGLCRVPSKARGLREAVCWTGKSPSSFSQLTPKKPVLRTTLPERRQEDATPGKICADSDITKGSVKIPAGPSHPHPRCLSEDHQWISPTPVPRASGQVRCWCLPLLPSPF